MYARVGVVRSTCWICTHKPWLSCTLLLHLRSIDWMLPTNKLGPLDISIVQKSLKRNCLGDSRTIAQSNKSKFPLGYSLKRGVINPIKNWNPWHSNKEWIMATNIRIVIYGIAAMYLIIWVSDIQLGRYHSACKIAEISENQ